MQAVASQPTRAVGATTPALSDAHRDGRRVQIALLLVVLYGVFRNGATGLDAAAWTITLAALLGLAVVAVSLRPGGPRPRTARGGRVGLALLAAFALWSGLTFLWTVEPSGTWRELNRAVLYAIVAATAMAAASLAGDRAIERTALGLLAVATLTALWAIAGKLIPGVTLFGLVDLDHTRDLARLRAPLGYWNALALICVLGIPIGLRLTTDRARSPRVRLGALAILFLLATTQLMTYSRGGILALVVSIGLLTALGPHRLRTLIVVAVVAVCAAPGLVYAFETDALVGNGVPLDTRESAGLKLLAILVPCLLALLAIGWGLLRSEDRVRWTAAQSRRVWRIVGVLAVSAAFVGACVAMAEHGGPRGALDWATSSFTEEAKDEQFDPSRVVTANSGNRWTWWKEAAGGLRDRPLGGWGAGSFPVVHKLYRDDQLSVVQPHSVPLQFLVETGVVGGLLALGAIFTLLGVGYLRVRDMRPGRERELGVTLLAAGVAWTVHGIFDWDWSLPGATLPMMVAMGTLVALPARAVPPRERSVEALLGSSASPGRWGLVALAALLAAAAIGSAQLPARAESVAAEAETIAGDRQDPVALEQAAARADLAARLDPVSVRPLFVAAAIAQGRGRLIEARRLLLDAVDRQPYSAEAWYRLALVALALADFEGFQDAATRALRNDPSSGTALGLARRAELARTPTSASATATGTPLAAAGAVAPVGVAPAPTDPTGAAAPTGAAGVAPTPVPTPTPAPTVTPDAVATPGLPASP